MKYMFTIMLGRRLQIGLWETSVTFAQSSEICLKFLQSTYLCISEKFIFINLEYIPTAEEKSHDS